MFHNMQDVDDIGDERPSRNGNLRGTAARHPYPSSLPVVFKDTTYVPLILLFLSLNMISDLSYE